MSIALQISPNKSLYIKDPQSSTLGRQILQHSVPLMEELGFEKFTFKKLALKMGASEISMYRYFENKHKLLLYLLSWYWEWVKYSIIFNTNNLSDGKEKLESAICTIVLSSRRNKLVDYIDEDKLYSLVVEESEKAYHTKYVDEENKQGFFLTLKSLKTEVANLIKEVNPDYRFANSLASTILEMSASLRFHAEHLPSMADAIEHESIDDYLCTYIQHLTFSCI